MPIVYEDKEEAILTPAQKAKFVTFVASVWPGAVADVQRAVLTRRGSKLVFSATGTMTVTEVYQLPDPPFEVDVDGSNYVYDDRIEVELTTPQRTAFIDFVTDTWTGVPTDVTNVAFSPVAGSNDIRAVITGTKTVASLEALPDKKVTIVEVIT